MAVLRDAPGPCRRRRSRRSGPTPCSATARSPGCSTTASLDERRRLLPPARETGGLGSRDLCPSSRSSRRGRWRGRASGAGRPTGRRRWPGCSSTRSSASSSCPSCSASPTRPAARSPGTTRSSLSTYTWMSQGMIAVVLIFGWTELADRVRTGDIAVDLARPVDLQLAWLAADLGRAGAGLLSRASVPLAFGAVFLRLALPTAVDARAAAGVRCRSPWSCRFACRFMVNLLAFWLIDVRGLLTFYVLVSSVLCGHLIPVQLFPDWLRTSPYATPFPSMLQSPIDMVTGQTAGWAAVGPGRGAGRPGPWPARASAAWSSRGPPGSWWCRVADTRCVLADGAGPAALPVRVAAQASYRASFAIELFGPQMAWSRRVRRDLRGLPPGATRSAALASPRWCWCSGSRAAGSASPTCVVGHLDRCRLRPRPARSTRSCCGRCRRSASWSPATSRCAGSAGWRSALVRARRRAGPSSTSTGRRPGSRCSVVTPLAGAAVFGALFVAAGGVGSGWSTATEFTNALHLRRHTCPACRQRASDPGAARFFTFVVPAAFVAYLPALALLGRATRPGCRPGCPGASLLAAVAVGRRRRAGLAVRAPALRGSGRHERSSTCTRPAPASSSCAGRPAGCAARSDVVRRRRRGDVPHRAGRVRRLHRRERRRQVDDHQDAHRHPGADVGHGAGLRSGAGAAADARWPGGSASCSASAASCGGTCRCASRSGCWPRSTGCRPAGWQPRLDECVALLEMEPFLDTPVRQLSLGQRMRGEVTAALLHSPELLCSTSRRSGST